MVCLEITLTYLVGFGSEENGTVADPECALLLLALLVDLGDGPSLNVIGLRLRGCGSNEVCGIDVRACRTWRLERQMLLITHFHGMGR